MTNLPKSFTPHDGGLGYQDILQPGDWIQRIYRGTADPAKGVRREYGLAMAFDWLHDGGDDDIIGYRLAPVEEG